MKKFFVLVCLVLFLGNLIFPSSSFKANTEAEVNDLYFEIQKNAWSRAPAKLFVFLSNLET